MTKITSTLMGMRAKEAKDSPTLRTRNGDDVRLLPAPVQRGDIVTVRSMLQGWPAITFAVSLGLCHRVCKAGCSGGRKKAGNNNNALQR